MTTKGEELRNNVQKALMVVLLIIIILMLFYVERFSKVGRLINYAGYARGGAQRYVKLELYGVHDQKLIDRLNKILDGLSNGSEELRLYKVEDEEFTKKLKDQVAHWDKLCNDTEAMEEAEGAEKERLKALMLEESEEYFRLSNDTVYAAENYSEKLASHMGIIEIVLASLVICISGLIALDLADKKFLLNQNINLGTKAYIDVHTGLPNKSKCEEVFSDESIVEDNIWCIMFDLNGLKEVNDRLGHLAGDELIKGFADILKKSVRSHDFLGRYGGDEFVAIIYGACNNNMNKIFERINANVKLFNEERPEMKLSYAYGYSSANGRTTCKMKQLLTEADKEMYKNKVNMKKKMANQV